MGSIKEIIRSLIILLVLIPTVAFAQQLCPAPNPLPPGQDDLRMREEDFTISKANESILWLEKTSWDTIRKHKTTEELLHDTEQFEIPFSNFVATVKGTLLRQQALIERQRLEIEKMKLKGGTGTKASVSEAGKRFDKARNEFCNFLKKAEFVD